jgi:polysaccharide pyruvyl transferase WcaK-like protein
MNRPLRALLLGGGVYNKGAEAMCLRVSEYMAQKRPRWQIQTLVPDVFSRDRLAESGCPALVPPALYPLSQYLSRPLSLLGSRGRRTDGPARRQGYDAILDVGGFVSSDLHGVYGAGRRWLECARPIAEGTELLFLTQSWGPFRKRIVRALTAKVLGSARLAVAREQESLRCLKQLDLPGTCRIECAPDIAFGFRASPPQRGQELLQQVMRTPPEGDRPLVGIAPNRNVYRRTARRGPDNHYVQTLRAVIEALDAAGASVVLIPHYHLPQCPDRDDRQICRLLSESSCGQGNVHLLDAYLSAADLKAVIGRLDFMLASRYHALIAAFSQGVPAACIGWAHKYDDLFKLMESPQGQISHTDLSRGRVVEWITRHLSLRSEMRDRLGRIVPAVRAAAERPLQQAAEILGRIEERPGCS